MLCSAGEGDRTRSSTILSRSFAAKSDNSNPAILDFFGNAPAINLDASAEPISGPSTAEGLRSRRCPPSLSEPLSATASAAPESEPSRGACAGAICSLPSCPTWYTSRAGSAFAKGSSAGAAPLSNPSECRTHSAIAPKSCCNRRKLKKPLRLRLCSSRWTPPALRNGSSSTNCCTRVRARSNLALNGPSLILSAAKPANLLVLAAAQVRKE